MSVKERLDAIQSTINRACEKAGRPFSAVNVIAVTKYVSIETTEEAVEAGLQNIGENRIEGAIGKWEALKGKADFHFIGNLQTRKVKSIVGKYTYLHSLDRLSLAKELDKRLGKEEIMKCFVQVNVSGEETKSGLAPNEVIPFIEKLAQFKGIKVIGLMTMAPFYENPEATRPIFRQLRELRDSVKELQFEHAPCTELSMGMSNDYEVAVEEGATYIRIGSALVGRE